PSRTHPGRLSAELGRSLILLSFSSSFVQIPARGCSASSFRHGPGSGSNVQSSRRAARTVPVAGFVSFRSRRLGSFVQFLRQAVVALLRVRFVFGRSSASLVPFVGREAPGSFRWAAGAPSGVVPGLVPGTHASGSGGHGTVHADGGRLHRRRRAGRGMNPRHEAEGDRPEARRHLASPGRVGEERADGGREDHIPFSLVPQVRRRRRLDCRDDIEAALDAEERAGVDPISSLRPLDGRLGGRP
ncbi:MAG TPA: hypothetical protein VFG43_03650, partial [Geminicoccaceae bacterium]|nr:hypothetical protein [Geminicoccaceae bacterium]